MAMNNLARLAGVFVLAFGITVGIAFVGGLILAEGTPENPDVDREHLAFDNVAPGDVQTDSAVEMDSDEPENTVVIQLGAPTADPIQDPLLGITEAPSLAQTSSVVGEESVTPLVNALLEQGHDIEFAASGGQDPVGQPGMTDGQPSPLSDQLADADAFITFEPGLLSDAETEAVSEFAEAGGRTVIAADPGSPADASVVGSSHGLFVESGFLFNMAENDNNYLSIFAEPSGQSELTAGVDEVVFRTAAPVGTTDGAPAFVTDEGTERSVDGETDSYGVAAVNGDMAMIGDSSFLIPENANAADNSVLIGNLADFLVTGDIDEEAFEPDIPDEPGPPAEPIPPEEPPENDVPDDEDAPEDDEFPEDDE